MSGESDRPMVSLPSVLNVGDLCRALRVSEDKVRDLVAAGELHRLAYSPGKILVARGEVWRFLRDETIDLPPEPGAKPVAEPPAEQDGMAPPRQAPHRKHTRWPLDAQG